MYELAWLIYNLLCIGAEYFISANDLTNKKTELNSKHHKYLDKIQKHLLVNLKEEIVKEDHLQSGLARYL